MNNQLDILEEENERLKEKHKNVALSSSGSRDGREISLN